MWRKKLQNDTDKDALYSIQQTNKNACKTLYKQKDLKILFSFLNHFYGLNFPQYIQPIRYISYILLMQYTCFNQNKCITIAIFHCAHQFYYQSIKRIFFLDFFVSWLLWVLFRVGAFSSLFFVFFFIEGNGITNQI